MPTHMCFCLTLWFIQQLYVFIRYLTTHYIKYAASKSASGIKTVFSSYNEENNPWPILPGMTEGEELSWMNIDKIIRNFHYFYLLLIFYEFSSQFSLTITRFSIKMWSNSHILRIFHLQCLICLLYVTVLDTRSTPKIAFSNNQYFWDVLYHNTTGHQYIFKELYKHI